MKKIIFQISLILLIISIGMCSVFITKASASQATITITSNVKVGEKYTVTVNIPSNAVAYQGKIVIKYGDGSTDSSGMLANITGITGDYSHPGNMSATFTAKGAGIASVSVEDCAISDKNGQTISGPNGITFNVDPSTPAATTPSTPTSTPSDDSGSTSTPSTNNNANNTTPQVTFTDVNETVYLKENCNVRKSYSTDSEKITKLEKGASLKRTGVGSNGWSRVEYNGTTAYISSQFLTTTEVKVEFKDVEETIYATQDCNLRKSWSTSSEKVGYLTEGQEVTRTGVADNGWSRINYNGQVVYVASRLLTTDLPEENEETNQVENEVVEDDTEETELTEEEILAGIQEEVGVLPEVGTNIAPIMYIIITMISIAIISAGIYYIKKTQ